MNNYECLEKLTKSFIKFLDKANIKYNEYRTFKDLSQNEKFF
jgi:hypothetical protein